MYYVQLDMHVIQQVEYVNQLTYVLELIAQKENNVKMDNVFQLIYVQLFNAHLEKNVSMVTVFQLTHVH